MGSEDLHKKRKAKKLKDQERKASSRKSYDRVLIICEGETEKQYFEWIKQEYKLSSANIMIVNRHGGDPKKNIVDFAKKKHEEAKQEGNPFDKIYCVFDKDSHKYYDDALQMENALHRKNIFIINSVPCFEYWLLLHFEYTTKSYSKTETCSIAENVIKDLKKHLPEYKKNNQKIFSKIKPHIGKAISNAKRANDVAKESDTDNPTTKIVYLVEYLIILNE